MTQQPLKAWIASAGITKHITFHCFSAQLRDIVAFGWCLNRERCQNDGACKHQYNTGVCTNHGTENIGGYGQTN